MNIDVIKRIKSLRASIDATQDQMDKLDEDRTKLLVARENYKNQIIELTKQLTEEE